MAFAGFKILVVDDSPLIHAALGRMLEQDQYESGQALSDLAGTGPDDGVIAWRYTVLSATSGEEALAKAVTDRPDLILLDIIMPGMDGFLVLTLLKESSTTRSTPVIIISGLSDEADEEKGFSLGAVDFITKPFKKAIALARIKTHLRIVEQMRIIEQLSMQDTLTGIPNRRRFDSHFAMEWSRSKRERTPISVLMVDVDHFKNFNDTHGHQQGDVVLKTVAATIVSSLKRPADLAARWGGEEFAVVLPNTPLDGAVHVAEQIRAAVEGVRVPGASSQEISVTISVGVASATPDSAHTGEDLIRQADAAMYEAKSAGRNRVRSSSG